MKEQNPIAKAKLSPSHRYKELEQENRRLQKELRRARMERDILKKAAAYFASHEL
jgi:transposase-like protein